MARTATNMPAGVRIADHISLGVLTTQFPRDVVEQVLFETERVSERERARDPDTLSFVHVVRVTRRTLSHLAAISPSGLPALAEELLHEFRAETVSSSRGRRVPRGVKRKMSSYPLRPRQRHRTVKVQLQVILLN